MLKMDIDFCKEFLIAFKFDSAQDMDLNLDITESELLIPIKISNPEQNSD